MKTIMAKKLKEKVDLDKLGFGKYFTDHMLTMEYKDGQWGEPMIVPYSPFLLDPSTAVFHYGQAVFEGLKAYRDGDSAFMFRVRDNIARLNNSCDRLAIPQLPIDIVVDSLLELVRVERDWIPDREGTSLYVRPCIIALENSLSVHASSSYLFFVILSPVGAYYANGMSPVKLYVEDEYVRACVGGTGHHKFAGNYAASLKAGEIASQKGCDQVLWLDAKERKYIEEVGSMNIFYIKDKVAYTPMLAGSILPGITRDSVIKLLGEYGVVVKEEKLSLNDFVKGIEDGSVTEAFGTGTAAVISPVGKVVSEKEYIINNGKIGEISNWLYNKLTNIQYGKGEDKYGWRIKL